MKGITTGIIIAGVLGASSVALMNMDKSNIRKAQRSGKRIMNKAENLVEDMRSFM